MLSYVPYKIQERIVFGPFIVVEQKGSVASGLVKIQKAYQLLPDAFLVVMQRIFVKKVSLR